MSAVSNYADYTTFQRFSGGKTSIQFLHNPIHAPDVETEKRQWTKGFEKDQQDAKELQNILQQLKNYEKSKHDGSHQQVAAYEQLLRIFESIKNARGESCIQIFRRQQQIKGGTQHAFEEDMADINRALIQMFQQNGIFETAPVNAVLQLGSYRTNIFLSDQQWTNPIVQELLKSVNVNSVKVFKGRENQVPVFDKSGNPLSKNLYRVLQQVQGKIDLASQSVEITQNLNISGGEKLLRLNELFKGASFTLKNYKETRDTIQLGSTNIVRVLYTTVNNFEGDLLTSDGVISFTYALAIRHQKGKASADIEKHLGHLQVMYELTGMGQEYINQDIRELKDYSKNGAKYLIVNTYDNDKIQVLSTKSLLLDFFDNKKYNHFQKTVTIGRSLLNKKSG